MKQKNIIIGIIAIIILGIVGVLLFNNWQLKKELKNTYVINNQLYDSVGRIQLVVTKYGDSLRVVNQIIASQQQAIEMGLIREDELKRNNLKLLSNVIELTEKVEILSKPGEYVGDIIFVEGEGGNKNCLPIPAQMRFLDPWYNLWVTADQTPRLDSLFVFSNPNIHIGYMKQGFLKRPKPVTIYKNQNPYIKLLDIQSLTIEEQKKWYQTTSAKVGGGVGIGVIIALLLLH